MVQGGAPARYSRHTRAWLVGLLIVTVLFSAGALFIKYQLESLREIVLREAESRTGAHMRLGAVLVEGLRGLRIDDLSFTVESSAGPAVSVSVPVAYIYIDFAEIAYGRLAISRIQIDKAAINVTRPPDQRWIPEKSLLTSGSAARLLEHPFRILGRQCALDVTNVVGSTRLSVGDFSFDVWRLPDSPHVNARLAGDLGGAREKHAQVDLRFASTEDFDLNALYAGLTAEDVNVFLPASQHFVQSGAASPTIHVEGRGAKQYAVSFKTPFENLVIRNQPDFLTPATGTLTVLATYDLDGQRLQISTAKAESNQLDGSLEGSVSLGDPSPEFDLKLTVTRLPLVDILNYAFQDRIEEYGLLDLTLGDPHEVTMMLSGDTESPIISANARATAGSVSFNPKDQQWPRGALDLGAIEASWDSETRIPKGAVNVTGGDITHQPSGTSAKSLSGLVRIQDKKATVEALNAEITGNPFVGSLRYDFDTNEAEFTANGTLSGVEHTPIANSMKNVEVAGSATVRGKGAKKGPRYTFEADLDGTQAMINYEWWFKKPPGVGANGKITATLVPRKSAHITADIVVASTPVQAQLEFAYAKTKMQIQSLKASSKRMDVAGISQCLALPYTVIGTTGTDGFFEWTRTNGDADNDTIHGGCHIDSLDLVASSATIPSQYRQANLDITTSKGNDPKGKLIVHAKKAVMPPFKETWFVPLLTDPTLIAKYGDTQRTWSYEFTADALELPPWKGRNFKGTATNSDAGFVFEHYGADIEKGHLDGSYSSVRADNSYASSATWKDVPASYFLDHMELPHFLDGALTGDVKYSLDRDDPGGRKGSGQFSIEGGQFSADFIAKLFEGRKQEEADVLPPSLKFSHLSTDFEFERDVIRTPNLHLVSKGIDLKGDGQFVPDGDMNYEITASIEPETANKIPALTEYFNIQGHRISQQKIDLTFHVTGPTFNPTGRVAKMPSASVTLVSGALQVTNEAMKVIEIPRKILVDLLKIGGGIMGGAPPS
ncbi:MAG: hypothetical protein HZB26_01300 [Candidatus Hydrogenedentes bacterium]|nr:hypothetical protein [Candidatus Hydrogenedentota bacterium]